jgi:hypothetical protein
MMERSGLLKQLAGTGNRKIVVGDAEGGYHFAGNIRNAGVLKKELEQLSDECQELVRKEEGIILAIYEEVFDHRSFTGRSGTFYGYEGLGSIYWHMVSKLLLAVCDTCHKALAGNEDRAVLEQLVTQYYEIRAGIGLNKTPQQYGAFPTDPYSHMPGGRGAQQPGMTGQVKEDIIARWGELGVLVREGRLKFVPLLLRKDEFYRDPQEFHYIDTAGRNRSLKLEAKTLAFTYCQVPVVYRFSAGRKIVLTFSDGHHLTIDGESLNEQQSASVFRRDGSIARIEVWLEPHILNF